MQKLLSFIFLVLFLMACEKNSTSLTESEGQVTLSIQYVNSETGARSLSKLGTEMDIASIQVMRARFLIRNVRFKTEKEDSLEFKSEPMVVELDLSGGVNNLMVNDIPEGRYDRLEFRVHRLDDDDPRDLAYFDHPDFVDFVQDNRYSMIIEGAITETNKAPENFIFRSRDSETQRHFLNPAVVVGSESGSVDVRLIMDGSNWFKNRSGGLLDPRDKNAEDEISDNLSQSIAAFSRDNRSSNDDSNYDDHSGY